MTVPVVRCGLDQLINLSLREVLALPKCPIRPPHGGNCSFFGDRRDQLQVRFSHSLAPSGLFTREGPRQTGPSRAIYCEAPWLKSRSQGLPWRGAGQNRRKYILLSRRMDELPEACRRAAPHDRHSRRVSRASRRSRRRARAHRSGIRRGSRQTCSHQVDEESARQKTDQTQKAPLTRATNAMSALGRKRTFRSARAMSALPPKADI